MHTFTQPHTCQFLLCFFFYTPACSLSLSWWEMKWREQAHPLSFFCRCCRCLWQVEVVHLLGMWDGVIKSRKKNCGFAAFSQCWCIIWGAPLRNVVLLNTVNHFQWIKNKVAWVKHRASECLLFHPLSNAWADSLILSCYIFTCTHCRKIHEQECDALCHSAWRDTCPRSARTRMHQLLHLFLIPFLVLFTYVPRPLFICKCFNDSCFNSSLSRSKSCINNSVFLPAIDLSSSYTTPRQAYYKWSLFLSTKAVSKSCFCCTNNLNLHLTSHFFLCIPTLS